MLAATTTSWQGKSLETTLHDALQLVPNPHGDPGISQLNRIRRAARRWLVPYLRSEPAWVAAQYMQDRPVTHSCCPAGSRCS
jgi:hypothetical protein